MPPIVETVLSVQFEPLAGLHTAHLGLLWEKFRRDFPRSEEQPPIDQMIEQFPEPFRPVGLGFSCRPLTAFLSHGFGLSPNAETK